jgi:hypothetical protein
MNKQMNAYNVDIICQEENAHNDMVAGDYRKVIWGRCGKKSFI